MQGLDILITCNKGDDFAPGSFCEKRVCLRLQKIAEFGERLARKQNIGECRAQSLGE